MTKKYFWAGALLFLANSLVAQVKIMPLGNSITMGRHGEPAGYRDDLSLMLQNEGINFDMVGSKNDGTGFYPHHEGHSGYRADEILDNLNNWLRLNPPDIVLLHIGTNDISQGESNESTIVEIENILDTIHNKNRNTIILFCNLIPRFDDRENRPQRTEDLNLLIYNLFTEKKAIGWDIHFVDQNNAIKQNPNWTAEWMDDYVHPNDAGYHVMAETFFQVLLPLLSDQTYQLAGHVRYYSNQSPIANANVQMTGSQTSQSSINLSGYFQFSDLPAGGNYVLRPEKNQLDRAENSVITMYNAALTLRHAVGVDTLNPNQQFAADVDRNGMITAFDAALIARYVVELNPLTDDHTGEWDFIPALRNYSNLNSNHSHADFTGILLGDVAGAWSQAGLAKATDSDNAVMARIEFRPRNRVSLPIIVRSDSILSFSGDVEFPEEKLRFKGVNFSNTSPLLINHRSGKIIFGFYSAKAIAVSDTIGSLEFELIPDKNEFDANVVMKFQVNQQASQTQIANLNVLRDSRAVAFTIGENYPNPFNPSTVIPYNVNISGELNVRIFNMLGQEVKTLLNHSVLPGKYELMWDGKDNAGTSVASGIYVCQFQLKGFVEKRTLVKLQ